MRRDAAEQFIVLAPEVAKHPEGITANPDNGDLYVGTFDFGTSNNKLLRFDRRGHLLAQIDFKSALLLGLESNREDHKVYICNFGTPPPDGTVAPKIQRVPANFTSTTVLEDVANIPTLTPGARPAPNALTFSARVPNAGDLFISDSFQGAIFKIADAKNCHGCTPEKFNQDARLTTVGFPPFGANGLAFNGDETNLFINNTGDDRVLRLNMSTKVIDVFAESINGADGIARDSFGRLWVCANQADEIVGLNEDTGRVIAKLGDFLGINRDGTPRGLLFPASNVIVGDSMFVTNLAIPLTGGDEPERDVTRWTISRIRVPGLDDRNDDD